ncbi:MAG: hypothetical protein EOP36_00105 [Rubrivivax sp.]|nr:MAG: hypothetical protein EOP36_00105 [Rubrivivax sp.]
MKKKPVYIIYSWGYSDEHGGLMALHKLCDVLNKSGEEAYMWPQHEKLPPRFARIRAWWYALKYKIQPHKRKHFALNPNYDSPIAPIGKLKDAIVIYPEIISGNPLRAKRVVRWFLNKPGRLNVHTNYSPDDLCFCYQETFNDPELNPEGRQLIIISVMDDVYKQTHFGPRSGTCYILRKGRHRVVDPAALDGPIIDGLSHQDIARIFNECDYCISYDSYSMYSAYAAMCGCKSIVVPEPGIDKQQWQPVEEMTYGIAYGTDDVESAMQTRDKMMATYARLVEDNFKSVRNFTRECEKRFSD